MRASWIVVCVGALIAAENESVGAETENTTEESTSEVGTTELTTITYVARIGINITITLSKQEHAEDCYLQTPQGVVIKLEESQINGVHVYPTRTNFVACRVVIGPIEEYLLGTWRLCGKHKKEQITYERCQPGKIILASSWSSTSQAEFKHVVNYGLSLSPLVRGTGTINTCHVITPEGEDIVLTSKSDYPGLERVVSWDTTICSVIFSVTNANFIGDWIIYGTFNSIVLGFNVVSQPMSFFLYDDDDPYSQAYNVTNLAMETHVLMKGDTVTVVVTESGTRNGCEFITNSGETYNETSSVGLQGVTFANNDNAACQIQVGPMTTDMFGEWRLIGKFIQNNVLYNELQLPFRILEEDPANPIPDEVNRSIEYLNAQDVYTSFGYSHTFSTASGNRVETDSCHVLTPDNLQFILKSGLVLPQFQTVTGNSISCGVQVHVNDEKAIGEWVLIARLRINTVPIERRLPFTIHVEEEVNAALSNITVAEGNSIYLRLEKPTSLYDTCVLKGPIRNNADRDENFLDTCGFIVRDITLADAGTWKIEYGTRKLYQALIHVSVTARFESPENNLLTWSKDLPIDEMIGPEDTVFCRIVDPTGLIIFQEFGRCKLALNQVRSEHAGVWKITIGTAGHVVAETFELVVKVNETGSKAQVLTSVLSDELKVILTCQLATEHEVMSCKFRDPSGKVLLANQGVGEDRYSFHGQEVDLHSEVSNRVCGLRITNPLAEDLGLWRCGLDTEGETYYGFLAVLFPWAMQDPEVAAAVISVPTLTAEAALIKAVEGNMVIMRCSVQSAIRYCYFRAQNGTVYSISPGTSDWFEYAGEGLDAGECSIRFPALQASDSGHWYCHVGFNERSEPEQRALIEVHVDALMVADQYYLSDGSHTLVVHSQVHSQHALEYCRFVRMDGLGFTSEDIPTGYEDHSLLANGKCEIRIPNPNILERQPWTVVAKIIGYKSELTRSTHTLTLPEAETEYSDSKFMIVWWCVLSVSLFLFLIGILLGPERNREWTYRRALIVRHSIRRSLIKKPLQMEGNAQYPSVQETPTAA